MSILGGFGLSARTAVAIVAKPMMVSERINSLVVVLNISFLFEVGLASVLSTKLEILIVVNHTNCD